MERIRAWIEGFLRGRYGYEGDQVYGLLAGLALIGALLIAVWKVAGPLLCVAVLALALLALRVRRRLRWLAVPFLTGAILVTGWLLIGTLKASLLIPPVPRFTTDGSAVVRNGITVIVACGEKRRWAVDAAPEPRTGAWSIERRGDCNVYYHHPPHLQQRIARHERAH